jgi:SAM-dependent methyltransferase
MSDFKDMTGEEYEKLYARFLKRSPDELLLVNGSIEGKSVIDLCAGGMRASIRAKELGAKSVVAVDESSLMFGDYDGISRVVLDVKSALETSSPPVCDLVLCQQGVNYWWEEEVVENIHRILFDGGYFVFNTFGKKPPDEPRYKMIYLDGEWTAECSYMVGDIVHHVQMREGMRPHISSFKWIEEEEFMRVLNKYFSSVELKKDGNTHIYTARK